MRIIDADRLKEVFRRNTGHDYSELIDIQPTVDVLDKIRAEIYQLHGHPKLDFIKNDEVVDMALDIIDRQIGDKE